MTSSSPISRPVGIALAVAVVAGLGLAGATPASAVVLTATPVRSCSTTPGLSVSYEIANEGNFSSTTLSGNYPINHSAIPGAPTNYSRFEEVLDITNNTGITLHNLRMVGVGQSVNLATSGWVEMRWDNANNQWLANSTAPTYDAGDGDGLDTSFTGYSTKMLPSSPVSGVLTYADQASTGTNLYPGGPSIASDKLPTFEAGDLAAGGIFLFHWYVDNEQKTEDNASGPGYDSHFVAQTECPIIATGPASELVKGTAYSSSVAATSATLAVNYELHSGDLPTGLTIDPETGAITGTPTEEGSFTFTVYAFNELGNYDEATYTLVVPGDEATTPDDGDDEADDNSDSASDGDITSLPVTGTDFTAAGLLGALLLAAGSGLLIARRTRRA